MRSVALVLATIAVVLGACGGESDVTLSEAETTTTDTSTSDTSTTSVPATSVPTTAPTEEELPPDERSSGPVVTSVTDGDTFDVDLDGTVETVRIIGVNAPESGECFAAEATAFLREVIEGRRVDLVTDVSDRDQYGRLLRYVLVDGTDVGVELVRNGFALARRYPPDTDRAAILEVAQLDAQSADVGLWAPDACGAPPGGAGRLGFGQIRFDATGDDNTNLNDEWVQVVNLGSSPVELTGWGLKDESASNRYAFPDGFVLRSGATVTVRTGCGPDTATDLHWCQTGSAVWNNSGDTAFLLDPAGNIVDSVRGP